VLSPSGFSGIYSRLQTVDPSQKNRRKITVLRFQELYTFFYIFFPVFRKYMVQKFPVIAKVKRFFYFMQVVEDISDNKPAPDSPFLCIFSSDLYCCRRTIDTDYVKSLPARYIASCRRRNRDQWSCRDILSILNQLNKRILGYLAIPWNFIKRYFLVKHKKRTATNEKLISRLGITSGWRNLCLRP
jgi:hypothetical protein